MQNITKEAIEAIGTGEPEGWDLSPKAHAEKMKPPAGPLKRILESTLLTEIIDRFNREEVIAAEAQTRYKRFSKMSAIASFLAVVISGILLLAHVAEFHDKFAIWGVFLQVALICLSFLCSLYISYSGVFQQWMHSRAVAEHERQTLFNNIIDMEEKPREGELPLWPLKLEYFRVYQLTLQLNYYKKRSKQDKSSMRWMNRFRIIALFFTILATIPLVMEFLKLGWQFEVVQGLDPETYQRVFLLFGLLGAASQGLIASYALISQYERNASRYEDTYNNLHDLNKAPLDEARDYAAKSEYRMVLAFIALVHEQMSSEHREWISLRRVDPQLSLSKLKNMSLPRLE